MREEFHKREYKGSLTQGLKFTAGVAALATIYESLKHVIKDGQKILELKKELIKFKERFEVLEKFLDTSNSKLIKEKEISAELRLEIKEFKLNKKIDYLQEMRDLASNNKKK
jgi:flagellar motility protein MotE (MotC chaperone)